MFHFLLCHFRTEHATGSIPSASRKTCTFEIIHPSSIWYFKKRVVFFKVVYSTLFHLLPLRIPLNQRILYIYLFQARRPRIFLQIFLVLCTALQRQNAENFKQIFPEKEYRNIGASVPISTFIFHIPMMELPFLLEEICGPILGICKSLKDTWMWLRPRNSLKRNI
jgi:hypothetical protein